MSDSRNQLESDAQCLQSFQKLANGIRCLYNHAGLQWESALRGREGNFQLVSQGSGQSIAQAWVEHIKRREPKDNHPAYSIVRSRGNELLWRVLVHLTKLRRVDHLQNPLSNVQLQAVVDLLNAVHLPLSHLSDQQQNFVKEEKIDLSQRKWKLDLDYGAIRYVGYPTAYICTTTAHYDLAVQEETNIRDYFSLEAKNRGFSESIIERFKESLWIEKHKLGNAYYFYKQDLFLYDLYQLTNSRDRSFIKAAAGGALSDQLPQEMGHHIGLFLTVKEGGRLARTCKIANTQAQAAKREAEEQEAVKQASLN